MTEQVSQSASQRVSGLQWVGLWLLQIPLYLLTSYLVRSLMESCYRLLIRGNATLSANFLLQHFLWVGAIGGFIAGLIGLQLLRAVLLVLPADKAQVVIAPRRRPQAWTWVLSTGWLAFGMFSWCEGHLQHSVLGHSPGFHAVDIIAAFFGSGCYLGADTFRGLVMGSCMTQITYTHPWLGTLAYSAAAFVPPGYLARFRKPPLSPDQPDAAEHAAAADSPEHALQ